MALLTWVLPVSRNVSHSPCTPAPPGHCRSGRKLCPGFLVGFECQPFLLRFYSVLGFTSLQGKPWAPKCPLICCELWDEAAWCFLLPLHRCCRGGCCSPGHLWLFRGWPVYASVHFSSPVRAGEDSWRGTHALTVSSLLLGCGRWDETEPLFSLHLTILKFMTSFLMLLLFIIFCF